ncbi:hypothetical protein DSO57_1012404 [Entomophthora muscae]|uniref:Uncharacterized protein n=1 Tax=Entomophthora muscae TaxID=34485 RepID=A0ACC2UG36_9FUNG|nr:hypothetical protein DSO57_1012404 [Entomophthora muscae]
MKKVTCRQFECWLFLFGKSISEDMEFCLNYTRVEDKLMTTGNNKNTRHQTLLTLLEIKQGQCTIQCYIKKFLKLKTCT